MDFVLIVSTTIEEQLLALDAMLIRQEILDLVVKYFGCTVSDDCLQPFEVMTETQEHTNAEKARFTQAWSVTMWNLLTTK